MASDDISQDDNDGEETMITETGRVVAVQSNCLWVETIQQSSCGACTAKKGCGHALLNDMGCGRRNHLRVLLNNQSPDDFSINDEVDISIAERVLVQAALIVYLVPLVGLLTGAILASLRWQGDIVAFIGAIAGFVVGIGLVKCHCVFSRDSRHLQPVVSAQRNKHCYDLGRTIAISSASESV